MAFANQNPKFPEHINSSEENPLRGFLVLAVAVCSVLAIATIAIVLAVQYAAPYIPFKYEQKIGQHFESAFSNDEDSEGFSSSQEFKQAESAIQELGQDISTYASLAEDIELKFYLMDEPDLPNAFATLGGHIVITTGLLNEVSSENALAFVIAHEIAHVTQRHAIQNLGSGVIIQLMAGLVFGSSNSNSIQALLGQSTHLTMLSFSRDMEYEADETATITMQNKYGHLQYADEFFRKISTLDESGKWAEFFRTHPDTGKRIEKINLSASTEPEDTINPIALDSRLLELKRIMAEEAKIEGNQGPDSASVSP